MKSAIAKSISAKADAGPASTRSRPRLSRQTPERAKRRSDSKSKPKSNEEGAARPPKAHALLTGLLPTGAALSGGALFSGIGALPPSSEVSQPNEAPPRSRPLGAAMSHVEDPKNNPVDSMVKGAGDGRTHRLLSNEDAEWLRLKNKKKNEKEPPFGVDAEMIGDLIRTYRLTTESLKSKINEMGVEDTKNKDFTPWSLEQFQHYRKGSASIPVQAAGYIRQLADSLGAPPWAPTQAQLDAQKRVSYGDIGREQRRRGLTDKWMTKDLNEQAPEGDELAQESYANMKHGRSKIPPWVAEQIEQMSHSPTIPLPETHGPPSYGISPSHLLRMYKLMTGPKFLQWANAARQKNPEIRDKFEELDAKRVSLMIHPGNKRPLDGVLRGRYRIPWWLAKMIQENYVPRGKESRQSQLGQGDGRWRALFDAEKERWHLTDIEMVARINRLRPFHKRPLTRGTLYFMKAEGVTEPWIVQALKKLLDRPLLFPTGAP